jgi:hypothetical protein
MSILSEIKEHIVNTHSDDIHYKKWHVGFRDEYFKEIYWSYYPITQKYFFEANPTFLYEYRSIEDMQRYPLILVRDGFVGILDFFLVNPSPAKFFKTILLIEKKFEKLVPKQWLKQVAVYEVYSTKKEEAKKENLLIHGQGMEDLFWSDDLDKRIFDIKKIASQYKNINFVISQRESLLSSSENKGKQHNLSLHKSIYEHFGFEVKINVDVQKELKLLKFSNFGFINLDHTNGFVSDNYIDHFLYSKGGVNLDAIETSNSYKEHYNLSPFHGVGLKELDAAKSVFAEFYLAYKMSNSGVTSIYGLYQSEKFKSLYYKHFSK